MTKTKVAPDQIEKMWQGFRKLAVPATASDAQVKDMRKAFFCGASSLFTLVGPMGPDDENVALAQMDSLHREISRFGQELDLDVLAQVRTAGRA